MSSQRDPTVAKYDSLAEQYDSRWASYIGSSLEPTLGGLTLEPGDGLLDVGCGTGQLLTAVSALGLPVRLFGIDPSGEMLRVAKRRLPPEVVLTTARAEQLPYHDSSFDWAVSTNAFHYIRDPHLALAECSRVLKSTGRLVITDWCDDYFSCKVCDAFLRTFSKAHVRTYSRRECEELLHKSSFSDVTVERYRISWLWGLMTAHASNRAA